MSEVSPLRLSFDSFELDESNARLTRAGQPVPLAPKALALLCELGRHSGQLVTKEALLDAVWGHQYVSESNLKTTISEVRAALADDAKQPRYIETVSRRGYRFIGTPALQPSSSATAHAAAPAEGSSVVTTDAQDDPPDGAAAMVGRDGALARMRSAWQAATAGRTRFFWIAGEAGIGKTLLVDRFVASLGAVPHARGQCIEQFGVGEPYLPALEALSTLCRRDPALVPLLRAVAPTWLLQLPWLCDEAERARLQRDLAGTHQDRMLREFAELLDRYTATLPQPLVLVTEDLHWSDHATVRLIDHLARRGGSARLLWLGTFRLPELVADDHPLNGVRHEMRVRGLSDEVVLQPFTEAELGDYIGQRFPDAELPERFVQSLHTHTDGLPLFVVNVIDDLLERGAIEPEARQPWPDAPMPATWQVPTSLAGVIDRQIARLSADQRTLLETASVCGNEFRLRVLAGLLGEPIDRAGQRCDDLAQREYWLRALAVEELNDGSIDLRYAFRHALYRHVFFRRLGPVRPVALHRRTAELLETLRDTGVEVSAAELASHCEQGRLVMAALRHHVDAVDSALQRFAPQEAMRQAAHALTLLPRCPPGQTRLELELALVARYGLAGQQISGVATTPEVTQAYERAQALCDQLPPSPERAWVMSGLGWALIARGEYDAAQVLAGRLVSLSESLQDPTLYVCGCHLLGLSLSLQADRLPEALDWLQRGVEACDRLGDRRLAAPFLIHPTVAMRGLQAMPLMAQGHPEQAMAQAQEARQRAEALGHPVSRLMALWSELILYIDLELPERVQATWTAMHEAESVNRLDVADGPLHWFHGWLVARQGRPQDGHREILEGIASHRQQGHRLTLTRVHGYAAEAMLLADDWAGAARHGQDGLALAERIGEKFHVPVLQLLLARAHLGQGRPAEARDAMRAALAQARLSQSVWQALQALVALCELDAADTANLADLAAAVAAMPEGHDLPLMRQAQHLLARAGGPA